MRAYLAGPDVFLPNAVDIGRQKVALCARRGIEAHFPLDNSPPEAPTPELQGFAISELNERLIHEADMVLANLTPFRSPSVDPGTAYEIGFGCALGKRIFGYTSAAGTLAERTTRYFEISRDAAVDPSGLAIENFGLVDNLMIDGAIWRSGGFIVARPGGGLSAMKAFEELLDRMSQRDPSSNPHVLFDRSSELRAATNPRRRRL